MSQAALDLFGRLLMTKVRDEAISDWKMIVDGRMKGDKAAKVRRGLDRFTEEQRKIFLSLVPSVVDTVLHHLLGMFEQEDEVRLCVVADDVNVPNLSNVSDGLAGELYSDEGWIARFSKEV